MLFLIKLGGHEVIVDTKTLVRIELSKANYEWLGFATDKNWQCGTEPKGETTVCLG